MYDSINDLPFVCRMNLPEDAQRLYQQAFNRAWTNAPNAETRHWIAQNEAWIEVRKQFEREKETGRWVRKATRLEAHVAPPESKVAAKKRSAR